jgi:hypothetical protein|tara:strand:+ start:2698 stop:3147 length:450 start_codon:yes stop_codon:yes gene_type:complete
MNDKPMNMVDTIMKDAVNKLEKRNKLERVSEMSRVTLLKEYLLIDQENDVLRSLSAEYKKDIEKLNVTVINLKVEVDRLRGLNDAYKKDIQKEHGGLIQSKFAHIERLENKLVALAVEYKKLESEFVEYKDRYESIFGQTKRKNKGEQK